MTHEELKAEIARVLYACEHSSHDKTSVAVLEVIYRAVRSLPNADITIGYEGAQFTTLVPARRIGDLNQLLCEPEDDDA